MARGSWPCMVGAQHDGLKARIPVVFSENGILGDFWNPSVYGGWRRRQFPPAGSGCASPDETCSEGQIDKLVMPFLVSAARPDEQNRHDMQIEIGVGEEARGKSTRRGRHEAAVFHDSASR